MTWWSSTHHHANSSNSNSNSTNQYSNSNQPSGRRPHSPELRVAAMVRDAEATTASVHLSSTPPPCIHPSREQELIHYIRNNARVVEPRKGLWPARLSGLHSPGVWPGTLTHPRALSS